MHATWVLASSCSKGTPDCIMSNSLSPKFRGLLTYEKEYLAVIIAVDRWRWYLQHEEFIILTDQESLILSRTSIGLTTPWQQKAFTKLLGHQYRIKYKKGIDNGATDALSWVQHNEHNMVVSSCQPAWLEDITNRYNANPQAQRFLEQLAVYPKNPMFRWQDLAGWHHFFAIQLGSLWIPSNI